MCDKLERLNIAYRHSKVRVGTKHYHARCFQCALCPNSVGRYYNSKYGKVCKQCYKKIVAKCQYCRNPIFGAQKIAKDGKRFHSGCFKCSHCCKVIKGGYFINKFGKYQHAGGCRV